MNERTKVALIGGLIAGVLSGLPVISGCCFLWALIGGFVTVFLYLKSAPGPLALGDAAKLGAIAGAIGAAISLVLGFPFMLLGVGSMASNSADLERAGISAGIMAVGGVVGLLLRAGLVVGFAVLGAIIGAALLGKKAGTPPPPPPPTYGGGTTPPNYGGGGGTTPPSYGGSGGV